MRYKQLGRTGLLVSELCFGTMTFGGGRDFWRAIGRLPQDGYYSSVYLYGSDLTIFNTLLWNNASEQIFVSDYADLVVMDREKPGGHHGELFLGELDELEIFAGDEVMARLVTYAADKS